MGGGPDRLSSVAGCQEEYISLMAQGRSEEAREILEQAQEMGRGVPKNAEELQGVAAVRRLLRRLTEGGEGG